MLAIVIPCYNEASRLPVEAFETFSQAHPQIRFIFVDDGSTDDTGTLLASLAERLAGPAEAITQPHNQGKAAAVRTGILHAFSHQDITMAGYWDADLATPLDEIPRFTDYLATHPEVTFLLGSRHMRLGTTITRSKLRHYLGRIFATAASNILGLAVYDTQCGAKVIHRDLALDIFDQPLTSRWLFDVELLARVVSTHGHAKTTQTVHELPLNTWIDPGGSRLKLTDFLKAPLELLQIRSRYHL